jgi:Fic family protein
MAEQKALSKTHTFINFVLDLRGAPVDLWLLVGEARSKCEHISQALLLPAVAQELHRLYLAKGVLATTAIEGNTLSEEDVLKHLRGELELPPSKKYLEREIENLVRACNQIHARAQKGEELRFSEELICQFNGQVLEGLDLDEGVVAGRIRELEVGVARYKPPTARECRPLLRALCDWLNGPDFGPPADEGKAEVYAIIKAIVAHVYLEWIHPFGDGNGRTGRLVEFMILIDAGLPTPSAHLLSNHYNGTRAEYYRQLDRAGRSNGDLVPFLLYAVRGFVDQLRQQLAMIHGQNRSLVWRRYVEEKTPGTPSEAQMRRRELVQALAEAGPTPTAKLKELTPRLAGLYATKTEKTLSRDLHVLEESELVARADGDAYRARVEVLQMLLPQRRPARGGRESASSPN